MKLRLIHENIELPDEPLPDTDRFGQGGFRILRVRDGLFYKGPIYKGIFTRSGKRYRTLDKARETLEELERIDNNAEYRVAFGLERNGPLEIVAD